ncbi:SCP2 sterol-binding domain-containing protein [Micromonospora sp. NPDC048830]|uniref:SCP2 sterol-binding domain-containing protein n=1 Tax=Micromonospora sp. NPDC048830 TaxID=3364257 RepID=UPI003715E5BC
MSETEAWFDRLSGRHSTLSTSTDATVRFDLVADDRTEHWYLDIHQGEVDVSHAARDADCIVLAGANAFERLASTHGSIFAAVIRNDLTVLGDIRLFAMLRKLIPGPPEDHDPREDYRGDSRR